MRTKIFIITIVLMLTATSIWLFHSHKKVNKQPLKLSGALEALNFWSFQRAYPHKAIPNAGHYAAFKFSQRASKQSLHKSFAVEPWQSIGPLNMGGRTLAIAFNPLNPNTIYAGSASGGLWRSRSAGLGANAWEYVATGFPVLAVSTIAIAPDDSNTIYIGTGEVYNYQSVGTGAAERATRGTYGIGILKTTDGGATWNISLDWSYNQMQGVWAIKINLLNPNTIWAATTSGTYKSLDNGATWNKVHEVIMANDLIISQLDTNIVVVACGNFSSEGHGIYRTTDGGETWTQKTENLPSTFAGKAQLAINQSSSNIMYASIGNGFSVNAPDNKSWLCRSEDSGENWIIVSNRDYSKWQGWFSHDVAVDPNDYNNVFAVGIDIWKSTQQGANLQTMSNWMGGYGGQVPPGAPEGGPDYSHADHHDIVIHPDNSNIVYFANDGGVFRTIDGGNSFEGCNGGYQTTQFYSGFSCSQQDSNLAMGGLQDNGTIIYRGSIAWDKFVIGGDGSWTAIDAYNDNIMYGSYYYLNLYKSTNKGMFWRNISPPGNSRTTCFIAPYVIAFDNPEVIYAGRDIVYKSTNGGMNWTATNNSSVLDGNPVFAMAISHNNCDVVYAATAPFYNKTGVFYTNSGGERWFNISGSLPDRFPGDIAVDPNDDSIVYIVFLGFGTSHVFKSNDAGTYWQDIGNGLPDVPTSAIVIDPEFPHNIYVGNDLGVYVSTDSGSTWQNFHEGLPDAVIAMDLTISPSNRKLRVATHGNGVYECRLLDAVPSTIAEETIVPELFKLEQNYPNPFNPETTITYSLTKPSLMTLTIYNTLGKEVKTLVNNRLQNAGQYSVTWDGKNSMNLPVAAGTYIYRLQAGDKVQTKKMALIK